ncbi:MAG TPA: BamA/TamA family outer membrane protein, partial [Polyangiales bacterium]
YTRVRYFGRFYYPLIWGMVFRWNTEAGLIWSRVPKGVPLYERFFLGGILSVRGFPYNDLGPIGGGISNTIDPGAAQTRLRIGGNIMLRTNVEVEIPIVAAVGIKGVVFFDAGNVWNTEKTYCQLPPYYPGDDTHSTCGFNQLRYSAGFGLRWQSPMGPLRFEWGIPLNRRPGDQKIRFDFTIGQFF